MMIRLLFFAQARERAGRSRGTLELPEGSRVADALAEVQRLHPGLVELMPHLAVAVNQQLVSPESALPADAELALLPPVSGGVGTRARRAAPATVAGQDGALRVVPATPDRWRDLERLFGPRGACAGCWCQWPRLTSKEFRAGVGESNRRRLRRLVRGGPPPGLIGYMGGEPVAWCALAPREAYPRIENSRTLARVDAQSVWSVSCFFVARSHRRRAFTVRLLREATKYARARGAAILEGYPVEPSGRTADAFAWWGLADAFRKAGFTEVARRSKTHPVMRCRLRGRSPLVMPVEPGKGEVDVDRRRAPTRRTGRRRG